MSPCWGCERATSPDGDDVTREYEGDAWYHDQCAHELGVPEEEML